MNKNGGSAPVIYSTAYKWLFQAAWLDFEIVTCPQVTQRLAITHIRIMQGAMDGFQCDSVTLLFLVLLALGNLLRV